MGENLCKSLKLIGITNQRQIYYERISHGLKNCDIATAYFLILNTMPKKLYKTQSEFMLGLDESIKSLGQKQQ